LPLQKKRNKEKEAFLYEFFDNEVKNHFQNFASLRISAPVFKAFENYSTPQEFFTAWDLKIYSDFPPRRPGRFRQRQKTLSASFLLPLPQTTLFYYGIENRSKF
jgi:hypothetical protein